MLNTSDRLLVAGNEIAAKVIDGEAILINLSTGMYYSMDEVGGFVWTMLSEGHSLAEIANAVTHHYDVAAETAQVDVLRLGGALLDEALVTVAGNGGAPPAFSHSNGRTKLPYATPELTKFDDMADLFALDPPLPSLPEVPAAGGSGKP